MTVLKEVTGSLLQLFFPHVCNGCGTDALDRENILCIRCLHELPLTGFENFPGNPVEKTFYGRLKFESASAQFYFSKETIIQKLMHEFKYRNNKDIGYQLGKMVAESLKNSGRFNCDALIPLPLFASKEKKRGYNQSMIICEGMSEILNIPVLDKIIIRQEYTETQTRKSRIERWSNIQGKFKITDPDTIRNKHVLLVDDVITTGATLEACGQELLKGGNTRLSLAALCIASRQ